MKKPEYKIAFSPFVSVALIVTTTFLFSGKSDVVIEVVHIFVPCMLVIELIESLSRPGIVQIHSTSTML